MLSPHINDMAIQIPMENLKIYCFFSMLLMLFSIKKNNLPAGYKRKLQTFSLKPYLIVLAKAEFSLCYLSKQFFVSLHYY